jgi:hypothetical protein
MKRVVTGERDGRAVFVDVTDVQEVEPILTFGMDIRTVWGVDGTPRIPVDGSEPPHVGGAYPSPGSVRVTLIKFGPDGEALGEETSTNEVADLMDDSGTHTTQTMDVGWIIYGELGLELHDGEIQWLQQGDVVVQNGTIHTWHNRSGEDALTGWVVIGAEKTA